MKRDKEYQASVGPLVSEPEEIEAGFLALCLETHFLIDLEL